MLFAVFSHQLSAVSSQPESSVAGSVMQMSQAPTDSRLLTADSQIIGAKYVFTTECSFYDC